jgi:hypothetical protein
MGADTLGNEGRGPRRQKKTAGVGLVLYFSIPIFFSPGGGIGAPKNEGQEEGQPPTVIGAAAGDILTH